MPKKRDIFVEIFQNLPKSGFFDLFFLYLPATQIVWSKCSSFYSGIVRKINLVDLKKWSTKLSKDF